MSTRARRLALGGEIALAGLLGLIALGNRSFWLDESASVTLAKLDWGAFAHELHVREANMSLYYVLLRWWSELGDSERVLRSLSVIVTVALVPVVYLLARRLADTRVALLACLFVAVNPMIVRYSQEARGYALCVLLVTTSAYLFVRGIQQPTWPVWIAYGLVAGLSGYAHFFGLLVLPAQALSLLFLPRASLPWRHLAGAAVVLACLLGPLVYLLSGVDPAHGAWTSGNTVGRLFDPFHDNRVLALAVVTAGAIVVIALWLVLRRRFGPRLQTGAAWTWALLVLWIVVPVGLVLALAVVYRPLFVVRYFIICIPPILLLASMFIAQIHRRWLAVAASVMIVAGSAAGVIRWYAGGQQEDWRGATRFVVDSARPGDGVMLYAPYVRIPFAVYLDQMEAVNRAPAPVYPPDDWETPSMKFNAAVPIAADDIRAAAEPFDQVWLVLSHVALFGADDPGYEAVLSGLRSAGFEETTTKSFDGVEVRRLQRG